MLSESIVTPVGKSDPTLNLQTDVICASNCKAQRNKLPYNIESRVIELNLGSDTQNVAIFRYFLRFALIYWQTHFNIVQRCQIAAPRWPNDISSAADNAIFKNRAQNIEFCFDCVAHSAVLLKPNVVNILLFNFYEQKFVQHGPITFAIDCNGISLLIFEEKWLNYASGPKFTPNSDSLWVRRLFNVCVRIFCAPNVSILLVYIPAKIKMSFIWKDNFFFLPKSASAINPSQANLAKHIHNHISWAAG